MKINYKFLSCGKWNIHLSFYDFLCKSSVRAHNKHTKSDLYLIIDMNAQKGIVRWIWSLPKWTLLKQMFQNVVVTRHQTIPVCVWSKVSILLFSPFLSLFPHTQHLNIILEMKLIACNTCKYVEQIGEKLFLIINISDKYLCHI